MYGLEIKLHLIIKYLGVTGACPRSGFKHPPTAYRSFRLALVFRSGICRRRHPHRHRAEADWAVMCSSCVTMWREAEHWHVRHLLSAMVGDDDAVGNGGAVSKERREHGVVSRSSGDTPDHRENALLTSAGHRAPAAMRVGCRRVKPRPTKRGVSEAVVTEPQ